MRTAQPLHEGGARPRVGEIVADVLQLVVLVQRIVQRIAAGDCEDAVRSRFAETPHANLCEYRGDNPMASRPPLTVVTRFGIKASNLPELVELYPLELHIGVPLFGKKTGKSQKIPLPLVLPLSIVEGV